MTDYPHRIALVTHSVGGGVWSVVQFLRTVIEQSGEYQYDIIALATSSQDEASLRLVSPSTWLGAPRMIERTLDGLTYRHVGAVLTEFEFQRYRPRRILTDLLNQYDLVQIVGGSPAWGQVAQEVRSPICIFAATTIASERNSELSVSNPLLRVWRRQMTRLTTRAEDRALAIASSVFAESIYTRRLLNGKTRPGALFLGPPGVDTDFFHPCSSLPLSGAIICVGRLQDPRKNVRLLLQAYAILSEAFSPPPLYLVGRGGVTSADWRFLQDVGIANKVKVFRDVSVEQLRDLYRASSLFVLPSNEEGLGIVILEAMACGLPVVSTDCGGPATVVVPGGTGLLTPVGDSEVLANAMRTILENQALANQMGLAGRMRVEQQFSIASAGRIFLDTYRMLLGNHNES